MKYVFTAIIAVLILGGCGDDKPAEETGIHFQGKDCLSCHNIDLKESSYLSIGGTVYPSAQSIQNDLSATCKESVHLQLLVNRTVQYDSKDYNPTDSAGFNGQGNLFALIRNTPISAGTYQIRLYNDLGDSQSSSGDNHSFSSTGFNLDNPSDLTNRFSCNACHQSPPNNKNGAPGALFLSGCS